MSNSLHDFEADVCPHCQYEQRFYTMPSWVERGAILAYEGAVYRVVGVGGTNSGRYHPHTIAYARVEKIDAVPWSLPKAPCPVADLQAGLQNLFRLPTLDFFQMERALHLVPPAAVQGDGS